MYIIWGMGNVGKEYLKKLLLIGIDDIELTDSNSELWGKVLFEKKIWNPEEVLKQDYKKIIITVGGLELCNDVIEMLKNKYGISKEKVLWWPETLLLSKDETYNLGDMKLKEPIHSNCLLEGKEFAELVEDDSMNDLEKYFFKGEHHVINKWFHYFEAYERFFSRYRGKDVTILEIGVFGGGSLQMWKNYFKTKDNNVTIYGIDIEPACKEYEEENIHIYIGSQEDRDFLRKLKAEIGKVDILIDDGGHTMNQQITTLEELFDLVQDDGIYVCEDLHTSYWEEYGGRYKGTSFIEYSKNLVDQMHLQYMRECELESNIYSNRIKAISYFDSMVFIEKRPESKKSICTIVNNG